VQTKWFFYFTRLIRGSALRTIASHLQWRNPLPNEPAAQMTSISADSWSATTGKNIFLTRKGGEKTEAVLSL